MPVTLIHTYSDVGLGEVPQQGSQENRCILAISIPLTSFPIPPQGFGGHLPEFTDIKTVGDISAHKVIERPVVGSNLRVNSENIGV
ncbi:hypothetical protein ES703_11777 [subsurface metagenome]